MTRAMRYITVAAVCAFMTACAATGSSERLTTEIDRDYVGKVNSTAQATGTRVIWVNLPVRKVAEARDDDPQSPESIYAP